MKITSDNFAYFVMKRDTTSSFSCLLSESITDKDFKAASSSSGDPYPWVAILGVVERACSLISSINLRYGSA